jgi:cell division protein FtsL
MATDEEYQNSLLWVEKITQKRQKESTTKEAKINKIRNIVYVAIVLAIICVVAYIIYRAYSVDDPPSILDEVRNMSNQIPISKDIV